LTSGAETRNGDTHLDLLQAFRLIDSRLAAATSDRQLLALRDRLAGELLNDGDRVGATLADEFELVTITAGSRTTTKRNTLIESMERKSETGDNALMWMELEDLVVDETAIAGQGTLRMLHPAPEVTARESDEHGEGDASLTSIPLAFFLRFRGNLMSSEVIYMESPSTEVTPLRRGALPTIEQLHALFNKS
jgi:hypothetical protein